MKMHTAALAAAEKHVRYELGLKAAAEDAKRRQQQEAAQAKFAAELARREYEAEEIRKERMAAEEAYWVDYARIPGVWHRYETGDAKRRKLIADNCAWMLERHAEEEDGFIDFHNLPFEGRVLFLPVFLGLDVGGAFPHYDFDRSNPAACEFIYVHRRGPAEVERWQAKSALVDLYLDDKWTFERRDATSIVLRRKPKLGDVIPFSPALIRPGEVLFGVDQDTGQPYYVPLAKLTHVLVGGQSGVGKSVLLNQCLRSLLANLDLIDELILVDLKGGVELSRYKALSPKIRFVKSYDELPDLADGLVKLMYERLDGLERCGELAVRSGFRIVIIDEFAAIQQRTFKTREEKERHAALIANLNLLAQQARAAGIKLWAQLQKPTADNMDSNFRTNLQSVICFFMPSKVNATSMFGELDGLPADPTKLGKGEFVFRDDAQNRTVLLKSTYCDEQDIAGLAQCVHPDHRMPVTNRAHAKGAPR